MPNSLFIALDGIDGTGKSTQVHRLVEYFQRLGSSVTHCIDPGGTELGAQLRELLLHGRANSMSARTEALLFMASRAELVASRIRPALARGEIVVSDRFLLANVVYQGHAGGLNPQELWDIGTFATGGLKPDLTIVFDLPVELARARRGRTDDRIESRGLEYDRRVRQGFLDEAQHHPGSIAVIDASADADAVHAAVVAQIQPLLKVRGIGR